MTEAEEKKIINEEVAKVVGDDMGCMALVAMGLYSGADPEIAAQIRVIAVACQARGVDMDK